MEFKDYYKTLGVERNATEAEIKSAFRKLARKHHPDVNPNNKEAEVRFKEVNEAYQVLSDPEKRRKYDQLGADWEHGVDQEELRRRYAAAQAGSAQGAGFHPGGAGGAEDMSDFFAQFFGFGGGGFGRAGGFGGASGFRANRGGGFDFDVGGSPNPVKAPDMNADVQITLQDAMHGSKRRLELMAQDECPTCSGTGMVAREQRQGKARVIRSAEPCPQCGGTGFLPVRRTLEVTIPPGVTEGTRIRLKGQGGRGQRPDLNGDLFLTVHLQPHPIFSVSGRDLRCELPIWDYEAVLGAEIMAPTINGRISLKIPAESQVGRVLRLKGRGIPGRGGERAGDLLYELKVLAPTGLTPDERSLMNQIAEKRRAREIPDPRAELMRS